MIVADAHRRDQAGEREEPRRHQHALPEPREIDCAANNHTGECDRDQTRDPRERIVDRRTDTALRRIDGSQNRRGERRHGDRQPEAEHHESGQHLRPEVERLGRAGHQQIADRRDQRPDRHEKSWTVNACQRAEPAGQQERQHRDRQGGQTRRRGRQAGGLLKEQPQYEHAE